MVARVFSFLFWSFLALSSIALFWVALALWAVTAPFGRRRALLHQFTCFWASLYTWLNPAWSVEIRGREKMERGKTYVVVANHLSLLDILVLFRLFRHFKWVSKIENFRVPFIGWNMSLNGYIPLRRGDRESIVRMLAECERTLAEGSSILMFPEGTRSPDGRMREFKPGAFQVAQRARKPILPLVIQGTSQALPKRGFILRGRHRIRISFLDELSVEEVMSRPVDALMKDVRTRIASALQDDAPHPEAATVSG